MGKVSRFSFVVLVFVSPIAFGEPTIQLSEPRAATEELAACADRKITHATGFVGMTEPDVLTYLYKYVMSPTAEAVINRHVDALPEEDLPEDATREGYRESSLANLEAVRNDFRDRYRLFSVVEHVAGISPERKATMWMPGAWSKCLYKWDADSGRMMPYQPAEDEGFNECLLWLGVGENGTVEGHLEFVTSVGDLWWDRCELAWDLSNGVPPAEIRVGEYTWTGHMQVN